MGSDTLTAPDALAASDALAALRSHWQDDARVSARSVLVTVLGDAIVPLGGSVWLSDLISLGGSLGFGDRLVRTSVSRLAGEGWIRGERVGRRSRYLVTDFAWAEIEAVDDRIYGSPDQHLPASEADRWLLVFLGPADADAPEPRLRWQGFAELRPGVWGRPTAPAEGAERLVARLGLIEEPAVALARFENLGGLLTTPAFRRRSGLAAAEAAYLSFVERYGGLDVSSVTDPETAFVLRTMLVHDYRRTRLGDPELPAAFLGDDWVGLEARGLAARWHAEMADASWRWLEVVTGLRPAPDHPARTRRFTPLEHATGGHPR